jgi:hypothetical protein
MQQAGETLHGKLKKENIFKTAECIFHSNAELT